MKIISVFLFCALNSILVGVFGIYSRNIDDGVFNFGNRYLCRDISFNSSSFLEGSLDSRTFNMVSRKLESVRGQPIERLPQFWSRYPFFEQLSHDFNSKAYLSNNICEKELLWQISLSFYPWNIFAIKNYAFELEDSNFALASKSLLDFCWLDSGNKGCLFQRLFSTNWFFSDALTSFNNHIQFLADLGAMMLRNPSDAESSCITLDQLSSEFREWQSNFNHLGYASNTLISLYHTIFHSLFNTTPYCANEVESRVSSSSPFQTSPSTNSMKLQRIRVGIIGERDGNSSPLLFFMVIILLFSL